jgi:hypothetical protein
MSTGETTSLPYIFDLLYDFKTVESLHDHLTGKTRYATSATDRELVKLMADNSIPLPVEYLPLREFAAAPKDEPTLSHYEELLETMRQLHEHAKRHDSDDFAPMDRAWVLETTGKALAKQSGIPDEQREAYEKPSPFLAK